MLKFMVILSWAVLGTTKAEATSEAVTPVAVVEQLVKRQQDTICIPEDHVFLRMRVPFLDFLEKGDTILNSLSDALAKFGTSTDTLDLRARRTCQATQMEDGICKLTSVTALTKEEDVAAYQTLGIRTIELMAKTSELKFQFEESDVHSQRDQVLTLKWDKLEQMAPWNIQAKDSGNIGVPTYDGNTRSFRMPIYPTFRPSVWDQLMKNLPTNANKEIVFSSEQLPKYWITISAILDKANELLRNYEVLVQQISLNRFPIKTLNLYTDLALINSSLTNMPSNFNAQKMMPDILQMPFSVAQPVKGWCGASTMSRVETDKTLCFLDIITIVPIIAPNKKYTVYSLSTIPQVDQTYILKKLKWNSIQIPAKLFIKGQYHSFFSNQTSLDCHGVIPEAQCNLCYVYDAFEPEGNPCLEDISESISPLTNCPVEKIDNPSNTLTQLTSGTFSYIDNTPGSLESVCPDGTRTTPLGYSGTITLHENCRYKLIDGPINSRIGLPPSINMEIIPRLKNPLKNLPGNTLLNDLNTVQIHFQNYGYIYLIAMAVVMVVMAIIIAFFCRLRCRYQTAKKRILKKIKPMKVSRKVEREIETQLEEMLPTTVTARPAPPKWPSINFLPNAISIRPT